jgi:hypothetical protein
MRIMPGGLGADQRLGGPSSVFVGRKLTITVAPFTWNTPWIRVLLQENGWDAMERLPGGTYDLVVEHEGHNLCVLCSFLFSTLLMHLLRIPFQHVYSKQCLNSKVGNIQS